MVGGSNRRPHEDADGADQPYSPTRPSAEHPIAPVGTITISSNAPTLPVTNVAPVASAPPPAAFLQKTPSGSVPGSRPDVGSDYGKELLHLSDRRAAVSSANETPVALADTFNISAPRQESAAVEESNLLVTATRTHRTAEDPISGSKHFRDHNKEDMPQNHLEDGAFQDIPQIGAFRVLGRNSASVISSEEDDDLTTIVPPDQNADYTTPSATEDETFLASAVLVEEGEQQEAPVATGNHSAPLVHGEPMNNRRNYFLIAGLLGVAGLLAVVLLLVVVGGDDNGVSPSEARSPSEALTQEPVTTPNDAPTQTPIENSSAPTTSLSTIAHQPAQPPVVRKTLSPTQNFPPGHTEGPTKLPGPIPTQAAKTAAPSLVLIPTTSFPISLPTMPVGGSCASHSDCNGNLCISNVCASTRLADLEPCQAAGDCESFRCGKAEESESAMSVCCKEGDALYRDVSWSYQDEWICSHLPTGARCATDRSCESQICLLGRCAETSVADGGQCDSAFDCTSGVCGKAEDSEFAPLVCCTDGESLLLAVSWAFAGQTICSHLKPGDKCSVDQSCESGVCVSGECKNATVADDEPCDSNGDCSNFRCAKADYSEFALSVCCRDGDALYVDVGWNFIDEWICSHLAVGDSCPTDRSCDSGRCFGKCIAAPLADGEMCDSDHDCENNRCGKEELLETAPLVCCPNGRAELVDVSWSYYDEVVCSPAGTELPSGVGDEQSCTASSYCSSGMCARASFTETSGAICCKGGEAYYLDVGWSFINDWFCGNRPDGTLCGDDRMCDSSSFCINGECASEQLDDGEACAKDSDCSTGTCALASFTETSGKICCSGGEAYYLGVGWSYSSDWFCGNRPDGTVCGDDRMCTGDSFCVLGECGAQRADSSQCSKNSDCSSGTCARASFMETSASICCEDGEAYYLDVGWSYINYWHCGNRPDGTVCGDDRMCTGGSFCVLGECGARLADGEACSKSSDCINFACAKSEFSQAAPDICCSGGEAYYLDVSWSYIDSWFCGNLISGKACSTNDQCASRVCLTATKTCE